MVRMTRKRGFFRSKKLWKELVILGLAIMLFVGGAGIIWLANLKMPDISAFSQRKIAQSTKIFDRTGKILLYDIHENTKRTIIPFEDISQNIKNATISIEDNEFYQHIGIKPTAILRAIIADLIPGGLTQGGSTITQQVIKNSVLTKDKTITRKLKEWVLAVKVEKILTKDQILSTYLNETPYGGSVYGVEEASRLFFGKSAKDVTLSEAAYIAAIPQAPTFYSPYGKNKEALDKRQQLVLRKMLENKFITQEDYDIASKEVVVFREKTNTNIRAPHFSLYVKQYLVDKYGEETVEQGGLSVITTLDYSLQEKAEEVVRGFAPRLEADFGASNTAMVGISPKTGDILMMIGSRDYYDKRIDGNFNITTAFRQPGSAFKPFVYATAFQKGYTPETILFDVKTEFSSECNPDGTPKNTSAKCYSPENYDGLFEGPETMKKALAHSRNIPAVKTLYLAGIKDSIHTAENMGITTLKDPNRYGLTLVLGGGEVSLLEITGAYGVFANDGVRNDTRAVLMVKDADGNILEQATENPIQAIPQNVARQINDALSDPSVRLESLNTLIEPMRREVAVKTGTTNDYRDVWIEGYTPDLVIGAWAGKNDNTAMEKKVAGLVIAPVWAALFTEVVKNQPVSHFQKPEPLPDNLKPVLRGVWRGGNSYFRDKISGKLATDYTPIEFKEEIVQNNVHSILYWLDKDNPNGEVPTNPASDNQFNNWEYGVRKWVEEWKARNPGFVEGGAFVKPTATDDVHVPENFPKVTITSPTSDSKFYKDDRITISATAISKMNIKRAEFFVNNTYLGSDEQNPFSYSFIPNSISSLGTRAEIRVVIYDDILNKGEATLTLPIGR